MPDTLNKQTLVNLLIDSPLREPIKINLIDIVNNTNDADLPKTYSTIVKELEIFQKATERRLKLADETIAKLQPQADRPLVEGGVAPNGSELPNSSEPSVPSPTSLPPLPTAPAPAAPPAAPAPAVAPNAGLSVPPLDLPPLPQVPPAVSAPAAVPPQTSATPLPPLEPPKATDADEAALAEIQKELDSLKSSAAADAAPTPAPAQ